MFVYLGALVALFVSAFWQINDFTAKVEHVWTLDNFSTLIHDSVYRRIALRTIGLASAVTLTDAVLAFPLAYFMARIAGGKTRALLFVLVLMPLWSSYLVRIYAWRTILAHDGALNWSLNKIGLPNVGLLYTNWGMWIVFSYIWLPFMMLPVYAALERIPDSYLEASGDLGARGWRTFRSVILPLALPGVVAGSIYTFSLTLVHYTLGRRGPTSLADLDGLSGVVGMLTAGGELVPLKRAEGAEDIRCENPARLKAGASFTLNGMKYRAIPDYPNQPAVALRHCAATSAYESSRTRAVPLRYCRRGTPSRSPSGLAPTNMLARRIRKRRSS